MSQDFSARLQAARAVAASNRALEQSALLDPGHEVAALVLPSLQAAVLAAATTGTDRIKFECSNTAEADVVRAFAERHGLRWNHASGSGAVWSRTEARPQGYAWAIELSNITGQLP